MNHAQHQERNADMGHAPSKHHSRMVETDPLRLAQAKLLGAQLETQTDTIEGVCETLRAEAQKKQQAYKFASAERAKLEARLTKRIQCREKMELDLETREQAQKELAAKVELARQNTHMLAERFNLVSEAIKAEAAVHQQAQSHWDRRANIASQLRSALHTLEQNYTIEFEKLRPLAAEERAAALSEARKCAKLESELGHQARQVEQTLANDRSHGVKLASMLAAEKEAVAATKPNMDEQRRKNQAAIDQLREAADSTKAEEQRNLALLAEFEQIGREFQALTAQYETGQSALLQTNTQQRTECAEARALTTKLLEIKQAASAATEESCALAQQAAESRIAEENAEQELRFAEQLLREKEAQCDSVVESTVQLRLLKEAAMQDVATKRTEEEKQLFQLNEHKLFLNKLIPDYSGIATSLEEIKAALAQKTAEYDQLQEMLHNKKTSLENAAGEKAKATLSLEAIKKDQTMAQTAHADQASLLSTAQESLCASNADCYKTSECLVSLETLQSEQRARFAELSSTLPSMLSAVSELESKVLELEQFEAGGKIELAQQQEQLSEDQISLEQLFQERDTAFGWRQSTMEALETMHFEINELAKEGDSDALKIIQEELQASDKELDTKRAALDESRVKVSEVEEIMAAIQAVYSEMEQHRQGCAESGTKLKAALDNVEAAEKDAAGQLTLAEKESLIQERSNTEHRAEEQRQKLVALANTLDFTSAQERAYAEARDLQLASVSEKNAITVSQRVGVRRRLEADIEHEQVASIRLKRLQRVAKARMKKYEKSIATANEEERVALQLQAESIELEKKISNSRELMEQRKGILANELKFLDKLYASRTAEIRALKRSIRDAESSVNNLLVDANTKPKSCLKSPKSPDSPSSDFKRVTFSSQSEVKLDSQDIQKVPTKRTTTIRHSQKSKKARMEKSRASQESPKSQSKRSISPKSNPFLLPLDIKHNSKSPAEV